VLCLARLLDEHWLIRLDCLDQKLRRCRADRAVEVNCDVYIVAASFSQLGELLGGIMDLGRSLDVARGSPVCRIGLECRKTSVDAPPNVLRSANVSVNPYPIPRRPVQKFVNRHAQCLAFDVPQRHVDAAQGTSQDWTSPVKRVPVDRLPVM